MNSWRTNSSLERKLICAEKTRVWYLADSRLTTSEDVVWFAERGKNRSTMKKNVKWLEKNNLSYHVTTKALITRIYRPERVRPVSFHADELIEYLSAPRSWCKGVALSDVWWIDDTRCMVVAGRLSCAGFLQYLVNSFNRFVRHR